MAGKSPGLDFGWLRMASQASGLCARNVEVVRWFAADTYVLLLLLGQEPMDALEDPEVALIVLACHTIDRERKNLFVQLRSELCPEDFARLRNWMQQNEHATLGRLNEEEGRRSLLAVVDQAQGAARGESGGASAAGTGDAAQRAAVASFEASEECKELELRERSEIRMLRETEYAAEGMGDLRRVEILTGE